MIFAILISLLGAVGIFGSLAETEKIGGFLGYIFSLPLIKFFGFWVSQIIFVALTLLGFLIFWYLLEKPALEKIDEAAVAVEEKKPSFIRKIFGPKFKVKEISPDFSEKEGQVDAKSRTLLPELKLRADTQVKAISYQNPPFDLLDRELRGPTPGDIRLNSAIIKKTLQNFGISVEMSEINVGPTVTQYTLKPAEGVKLAKITALSNDLALALASLPIRIEAPIPGKSLAGIEVPNKIRARVKLRDLIESPDFLQSSSHLNIVLGRDVSGKPVYADLAKMPHLLVAGSTGTGKTIFLNNLVLPFLYRNSPEILRFILVDPKRVEFQVYNELPHLLCPVIHDASRTVNAVRWLISEMERRFEILSLAKTRDIMSYNEKQLQEKADIIPYIILIVDELADLMAAKGKEVEAGIVRLAQMARAVGIHLIVATQRPSVEVITGLIKANITSRITFQVASQVDSRTVLDAAGAEKLLGLGDLLYLSAEVGKPRRIQSAFVSEKEVRKVVNWIKLNTKEEKLKIDAESLENKLAQDLEKSFTGSQIGFERTDSGVKDDPLYEEAKRVVVESRKASASLLQRRLRIGYARAARLLDILEETGIVGPGQGAKPREVFIQTKGENENEDSEGWQKV